MKESYNLNPTVLSDDENDYIEDLSLKEREYLIKEYRDLTEKIVELNKKRYIITRKLLPMGIKTPGLEFLRPDGIA